METRVLTTEDKAEFEAMKEREAERDKIMREMQETISDLKKDRKLP